MKRYIAIIFLLLCWACSKVATTPSELVDYIPRKASVVIKTYDLEKFITETKNHNLLKNYKPARYTQKLNEYSSLLTNFKATQESLIAFTQIGKNDVDISFISKYTPQLIATDSSKVTLQKLTGTTPSITKVTTKKTSFYTVIINDIFIASSSQILLENSIREKESSFGNEKSFIKAYNASTNNEVTSILLKGSEASSLWSSLLPRASYKPFNNAFSWIQADLDLSKKDLKLNGVVLVKDSTQQYLELFKNTTPQVNKIAHITPKNALNATSITYDDWGIFKNNLAQYKKADPSQFIVSKEELLSSFNEIGLITLEEGQRVIIASSIDTELSKLALSSEQEQASNFRQVAFYKLEEDGFKSAFAKAYAAILPLPKVNYYCVLDNFYLFAPDQNSLETIVANYQNKATMAESKTFQSTASQLTKSSSVLMITYTSKIPFKQFATNKEAEKMKTTSSESYPYAALQLVQDQGFMHLQAVINKSKKILQDGTVTQIASTKLDEAIMMSPKLVKNHRTKGMDVILQDQANQLYLLNNNGDILWKKELDSPIVGEVQQVDLYRNGRLQLAFTTQSTFYILDRNGKEVKPFPIKFQEEITQAIAVFDYEKNRNYRFIITQKDKVTMYDKNAKKVTGFTFTKANDEITLPPQHIRIGDKDYIVIPEKNGNVNILNRIGKSRIKVTDSIPIGASKIAKSGTGFATYDINGQKTTIGASGKVSTIPTDYGKGSEVVVKGKTHTCIRENILHINTEKVTLPYGSYTTPTINTVKGKNYISCTNTESNKVYVFDSNAKALENFPVYGFSAGSIGHLKRHQNLGLVTQGDDKTVLIYRIN